MLGLRTQESNSFQKFFEVVQSEAAKAGKVFFLDCEEGHDGQVNGMETCNLSGWLVPADKADDFASVWEKGKEDDEWADFFSFVRWTGNDGLKISFE